MKNRVDSDFGEGKSTGRKGDKPRGGRGYPAVAIARITRGNAKKIREPGGTLYDLAIRDWSRSETNVSTF